MGVSLGECSVFVISGEGGGQGGCVTVRLPCICDIGDRVGVSL